jgi:hypothetical protein
MPGKTSGRVEVSEDTEEPNSSNVQPTGLIPPPVENVSSTPTGDKAIDSKPELLPDGTGVEIIQCTVGKKSRSSRARKKLVAESERSGVSADSFLMTEVSIPDLPTEDEIDAAEFEFNYHLPTGK